MTSWSRRLAFAWPVAVILATAWAVFELFDPELLYDIRWDAPGVFVLLFACLLFPFLLAILWRSLLSWFGIAAPQPIQVIHVQLASWLGRYFPIKVGQLLGKIVVGQRHGIPASIGAISGFMEVGLFIFSGCIGAGLILLYEGKSGGQLAPLLGLVGVLAVPPLYNLIKRRRWLDRLPGRLKVLPNALETSQWLVWVLGYLLTHFIVAVGFYFLLDAFSVRDSVPGFIWLFGVVCFSHVSGILVFVAPAGIGAREAALTFLFAPYMGLEVAATVSAVARVISLVADAILVPLYLWVHNQALRSE